MRGPAPFVKKMAEKSAILYCEIGGKGGIRYFMEPGGRSIGRLSAARAIKEGWIVPVSPGLFGDPALAFVVTEKTKRYYTEKERDNELRREREMAHRTA